MLLSHRQTDKPSCEREEEAQVQSNLYPSVPRTDYNLQPIDNQERLELGVDMCVSDSINLYAHWHFPDYQSNERLGRYDCRIKKKRVSSQCLLTCCEFISLFYNLERTASSCINISAHHSKQVGLVCLLCPSRYAVLQCQSLDSNPHFHLTGHNA